MSLYEDLENLKFDTRMIDWNLIQKKINPQDIQKNLDALEDVSHLSKPLQLDEEDSSS